jgi:hypothetical protein
MNRYVRPNLDEHRARIALLHILQQMGVDTRSLELEFTDTLASREKYHVMWLQAAIQLCVEQLHWQQMNMLESKQMAHMAAARATHQRAKAAFWTMFIRAFASVAYTGNAHVSKKPTTDIGTLQAIRDAMVACIVALRTLESDFAYLQTEHTNRIHDSLASVLGNEIDQAELQKVAARLLDLSETQRLTEPVRGAKVDDLAHRNLLGPMAQPQNLSFQMDKITRLGTSENPGGLNLEILMMGLLLEQLNLPISKAKLVLKQVRPDVLNAWQQNGQFQKNIDAMLNRLNVVEKVLADQQNNPSIEPALFKNNALLPTKGLNQRPRPSPSISANSSEDRNQKKEALDNDSIAEEKRLRSPLRDALRRLKNPWALP